MPISKEFAGSVSFVHTHQELHASMQRYLPELEIVHEFNKGSDTTRVLVPTGENLILVTKDNISTSFEFNPTQSETLGVYLPHDQKYPPAVPHWKRRSGLGTLYTLLYLSDLKNEMQYDSQRFTKDKKTISFFNVSTLTPFLKPFSKIKHARLVNFRATMNILEPSTELTQNFQFQNLWRDVNQGVVKNSKLLSLYQITLNSQTTSAGKIQSEQRDLAIMLVEGQFTTKQLKNQTERKFFNEREIQFVVRQLDFQSNTDTSVEDLSRIIGLLREQSAVVRPYRG